MTQTKSEWDVPVPKPPPLRGGPRCYLDYHVSLPARSQSPPPLPLPPIFQSVPVDAPSRVQYWKAREAEAASAAAKAMKQRPFRSCGATFSGRSDAADESGGHKEGDGGSGGGGRRHQGTGLIEKSTELSLKHLENGFHVGPAYQTLTQLFAY